MMDAPESKSERLREAGPIRILVADDHAAVREGLSVYLSRRHNMEIVAMATDGQEAVMLYRKLQPDVTLMDIRMPRMDGLAATRTILHEDPEARIIVLTASEGVEEAALTAGARAVILKDAPREELIRTIRAA